jgi:GMP synthase-like glutamine amidotransferase
MYIYVRVQDRESYYSAGPEGRIKARLELASGEPCLVVPHFAFDMRLVQELRPRAIAMSGFGNHFQSYDVKLFLGMDDAMRHADLPIICFCGSHQLLGFAFNGDLSATERLYDEPMRRLEPDEEMPRRPQGSPEYDLSGYFVAEGFYPIRKVKEDPLFAGLPETMIMRCSHYCEVKRLPPGFELLATGGHCRIEAMRHVDRPLYGTQFHPEAYERPFFDGRTLLENFAAIVDDFWRQRGR